MRTAAVLLASKPIHFLRLLACTTLCVAAASQAATLTVTSTADNSTVDGTCTLREAISAMNAGTGSADCPATGTWGASDTIGFGIPVATDTGCVVATGVCTIRPAAALPTLTRSGMTLDGYTQTGATPNTNPANAYPNILGLNGAIKIEIDGALTTSASGLQVGAGNQTVAGLSVINFSTGIAVWSPSSLVAGNYIGVHADGVTGAGNMVGIQVNGGNGAAIGSSSIAARRNLVAGNYANIGVANAVTVNIGGNLVGTDATGAVAITHATLGTEAGIGLTGGSSHTVSRNVIAASNRGLAVSGNVSTTQVSGNAIGVGVGGVPLGNATGVHFQYFSGAAPFNFYFSDNAIANSTYDGVWLAGNANGDPADIRLDQNWIWNNGYGIDLQSSTQPSVGVPVANDVGDADTGPNQLQNYPVITSATVNGTGVVSVAWTLNSTASHTYGVSVYANDSCHANGYGEGQYRGNFLPTTITTNASGNASGTITVLAGNPGFVAGKWATMLATDSSSGQSTSEFSACVQILGTGVTATPDASAVDFGSVVVGATSATHTVTITNYGAANLVMGPGAATLTGANLGDFAIATDNCSSQTVAPSASCTVILSFTPTAIGARAANLSLASNDPASPLLVALSGTGTAAAVPIASPSPASLAFGSQTVGTSSTQTVTITNTGTAPLVMGPGAATLTGANLGDFAIATDNCSSQTVAPSASCTVILSFTPTAIGARAANLSLASNDPASPLLVALSGTGTAAAAPIASPSPTSLAFGSQTVGTSSTQTVTITNIGTAPLVISDATINPTGGFAIQTNNCLTTVAPNASCMITVVFAPAAVGASAAALSVTSNAGPNPLIIALSGAGVAGSAAVASVPTLSQWALLVLSVAMGWGVLGLARTERRRA